MMEHGLALDGLFDRAHLVAHPRRVLEFEPLGMELHPLAHLVQQLEVLAFQEQGRGAQMAFVLGAIDRRGSTAPCIV